MLEIKTGRWYRLIGGELLRVDAVDQAAGIVDGAYQSGSGTRLALSAFTGAVEVPPPAQAPVRNRVLDFSLDQPLDQPADADAEEPLDGPLDSVIEAAPKSGAPRKARLDLDATLEELDRAFTAEAAAEEAAAAAEHAPAPVAAQAPARPAPGETAALPFAEPDQAASATPGDGSRVAGLSPLVLGILLGMIVLAGAATALVVQSRQSALEAQLEELRGNQQALAERMAHLQPGDAPGPDQRLAALQAEAAAQQQSLAALRQQLEWALEKVDTSLGQFDARLQQLEQRARTPAAPVAKAAPAAKPAPAAPPAAAASGGFTVVVASFPTRAQAEQSLAALAKAGEPLRLRAAVVDGKTWYRVQAEGFADRAAAQAYARRLASRHGIGGAWVASP